MEFFAFFENVQFIGDFSAADLFRIAYIAFILIDVVLLIVLLYVLRGSLRMRRQGHPNFKPSTRVVTLQSELSKKRWERASEKINSNDASNLKLAIIEADKLMDDTLKKIGVKGDTTMDRIRALAASSKRLSSLDRVMRAHRIRNNIVHTPDFAITPPEARRAMEDFESFLREIKAI
jgi:hypothetical protein